MKVLVTGGAGFIGSHLCERLVDRAYGVVAADNLILGRLPNLATLEGQSGFKFVEMDVAEELVVDQLFEEQQFGAVFHLAANSDIARSHLEPHTDFRNTLCTTWSVLEAMRRHSVKKIVFASTSAIYGEVPGIIREDYGPLMPISHYGAAKLASEALISSFSENYGIQAWIARFPNVVGDRATHGAVRDFVRKLKQSPDRLEVLGDGSQEKPYIHVQDLIDAMLLIWDKTTDRINLFNIGGSTRCSAARIAEIVIEESALDARIDYTGGDRGWIGDVPSVDYDIRKIRTLGWEPRLDSESAIRAAAQWMLKEVM